MANQEFILWFKIFLPFFLYLNTKYNWKKIITHPFYLFSFHLIPLSGHSLPGPILQADLNFLSWLVSDDAQALLHLEFHQPHAPLSLAPSTSVLGNPSTHFSKPHLTKEAVGKSSDPSCDKTTNISCAQVNSGNPSWAAPFSDTNPVLPRSIMCVYC